MESRLQATVVPSKSGQYPAAMRQERLRKHLFSPYAELLVIRLFVDDILVNEGYLSDKHSSFYDLYSVGWRGKVAE